MLRIESLLSFAISLRGPDISGRTHIIYLVGHAITARYSDIAIRDYCCAKQIAGRKAKCHVQQLIVIIIVTRRADP